MKAKIKTYNTKLDFHISYTLCKIFAELLMDNKKYDETFKTYMGYDRPFDIRFAHIWLKKNLYTPVYEICIDLSLKYDVKQYFITQLRRKLYQTYGIKVLRKYPYMVVLTYEQMNKLICLLQLQGEI